MGFFGYNEEEFLDEDEKRLRRESKERARHERSGCAADHRDDGRDYSKVNNQNSAAHSNCKADHSDDRTTNQQSSTWTTKTTSATPKPELQSGAKITLIVVLAVVFTSMIAIVSGIVGAFKISNEIDDISETSDYSIVININDDSSSSNGGNLSYAMPIDIANTISENFESGYLSKAELISELRSTGPYTEQQLELLIDCYSNSFDEVALRAVINQEEDVTSDPKRVREFLEEHEFTEENISYVISELFE